MVLGVNRYLLEKLHLKNKIPMSYYNDIYVAGK